MPKFLTPTLITPSGADAWVDVDLSAYLDSDAIGAFLMCHSTVSSFDIGWRKKGANATTENRTRNVYRYPSNTGMFVGVDTNQVCQLYVDSVADCDIYLMGFCVAGEGEFFTDALEVTPGTTGSYQDIDITASTTGTPKCVFLEVDTGGDRDHFGMQPKGSSDSYEGKIRYHAGLVCGCDANGIFQINRQFTTTDVLVLGYLTDNVTVNINGVDESAAFVDDTWTQMIDFSPNAGAAYRFVAGGISNNMGVRLSGSTDDVVGKSAGEAQTCWIIGAADGLVEGFRSTQYDDIYRILEFQEPTGGAVSVALDALGQSQSLGEIATTQHHAAVFTQLDQTQALAPVGVVQAYSVQLSPLDAAQLVAPLNVAATSNVTFDQLDQNQAMDVFAVTQHHVIAFDDLSQSQAVASIGITVAGSVVLLNLYQLQSQEALAVTQAYSLNLGELIQTHSLEPLPVGQILTIDFGALQQAQAIDNITVLQLSVVVLNALAQGHSIDGVEVTLEGVITIADVGQLQNLTEIPITQYHSVSLIDLSQLQTLDALPLAVGGVVTPPERVLVFRHGDNIAIVNRPDTTATH